MDYSFLFSRIIQLLEKRQLEIPQEDLEEQQLVRQQ